MAIHHLMVKTKDWPKAKAYYTRALKPLGYEPIADWGTGGGFGVPGEPTGAIYVKQEESPARMHFALSAPSEAALREYYKEALEAGGKDNGAPGPRSYHPVGMLACFVIDLDDNNIEVDYLSKA